jgi:ABC-2 type transport system permease protein
MTATEGRADARTTRPAAGQTVTPARIMAPALAWTEVKLLFREPLVLVVTLGFPILLMVLLLASFSEDDGLFAGLPPTQFYVTAYAGASVAAMGFMGLPTHLAGYRAGGVLRRFRAAGIPASSFLLAQTAVMAVLAAVGAAAMIGLAYAGFDLAAPESVPGVVAGFVAGIAAFTGIGALLGVLLPSARAAQGLGLLLFFGTFFVAGGGPPEDVLPVWLNDMAALTPTGLLIEAIRAPWTTGDLNLAVMATLAGIAVAGFALATARLRST